ncbi:MAG: APC family permease [Candidatus Berkiellales bacterium]
MSRQIGFWPVFALVTGSQIGTGVFMLPTSLAPFGVLTLLGWGISGLGAVMLALVFSKLCSQYPQTGGPHVYVEKAFGASASLFTGWTYWVISWVSSTAVISASVSYMTPLIGEHSQLVHFALEISLLLVITIINLRGVKTAGTAEFFLTMFKIIPLALVPFCALFFFDTKNFAPITANSAAQIAPMISHVVLITLWGFIGLESATTPAGMIENPTKTIPRAVILGTLFVATLYFFNSFSMMGALPAQKLMASTAPYADVTQQIWGGNWHLGISLIAAIVCIGTLNAWVLSSGQIALGVAQDGLMPAFFAKRNRHGAPVNAILVSSVGIVPILFLTLDEHLAKQINMIIDFSVTAFVFVYLLCCLSFLKLLYQQKLNALKREWIYGLTALSFCGWVIASTPLKTLLIAGLFVASGIPIYWLQRRKRMVFTMKEIPVA